MSNSNNFTKRIRKYGAFGLSALLLSSCVNDKYDLSKEIDTSLSLFEDGISMPVGSTDTIFMKQIIEIEENGEIKIDRSTGDYYLYKSEKTDTDMNFNIEDSNVDADGIDPFTLVTEGTNPYPGQDIPELPSPMTFMSRSKEGSQLTLKSNDISDQVLNIRKITCQPSYLTISMMMHDADDISDIFYFGDDFRVELPNNLICDDPNVFTENGQQYLSLAGEIIHTGTPYLYDLKITGYHFGENGYDVTGGTISQTDDIKAEGSIYITSLKGTAPADIEIPIEISTNDFYTNIITAEVKADPNIDPINDEFDINMDDIPEALRDEDVILDLSHAAIKTRFIGDSPMDIFVSGNFESLKNNSAISNVPFGTAPGEEIMIVNNADNYIYFTDDESEQIDGYRSVYIEDMSSLFYKLPDMIKFNVEAAGDTKNYYEVPLNETFDIQIEYEINIPFSFGDEMYIVYNDTIDIDEDLDDVETSRVMIDGIMNNAVPMNITLKAKPVDADGNLINGLSIDLTPETLDLGDNALAIIVSEENGGNVLESLKGIVLEMTVTNEQGENIHLNSGQYVILKDMKLHLPEGIVVNNL